jgi:hypothetical protein
MIFFQQYGARRTGTNYLQALVEHNFNNVLLLSTFHWKHGHRKTQDEMIRRVYPQYPDLDVVSLHCYKGICGKNDEIFSDLSSAVIDNKMKTIVSVKDPYAWIDSMWRWSINTIEKNVEEYGYIEINKGYEILDYEAEIFKLIHSYNDRYFDWCVKYDEVIPYESLLSKKKSWLDYFGKKYDLSMKREFFLEPQPDSVMDPAPIRHQIPDWNYNTYYLEKKYLDNLPMGIIELITNNINWNIFEQMGYKRQT